MIMPEGFEQARDLITHNASFQVACQRYAHGSGSSEAIAAAALRVLDIYPKPVIPDLIRGPASSEPST